MGIAPTTVALGGQNIPVPRLPSAVGQAAPAYPIINLPAATALVDDALGQLAELRNAPTGPGGVTPQLLSIASAVAGYQTDRPAAVAAFQHAANVGTPIERTGRIILPDGTTWRALFSYGRMAAELDCLRDHPRNAQDYVHTGRFDHAKFLRDAETGLRTDPATYTRFSTISLPNFDRMLTFMEGDPRIIDVRWMAYMFATTFWEAASVVTTGRRADGRPIRQWQTVAPIEEIGRGVPRNYARPVKVEQLGPTHARITEWDGNGFEITQTSGTSPTPLSPRGTAGTAYNVPVNAEYTRAAGDEHTYYGRGYVQLTWFYNYAAAGVAIGRGFDLLYRQSSRLT